MPVDEVRGSPRYWLVGLGERGIERRHRVVGRQRRRARPRLATRPSLLLFDDPTTGLDPLTAITVDDEIVEAARPEQVTPSWRHRIRDAPSRGTSPAERVERQIVDAASGNLARFMVYDGQIIFKVAAKNSCRRRSLQKVLSNPATVVRRDPFLGEPKIGLRRVTTACC